MQKRMNSSISKNSSSSFSISFQSKASKQQKVNLKILILYKATSSSLFQPFRFANCNQPPLFAFSTRLSFLEEKNIIFCTLIMDFHTLSLASLHRYAALYHLSYSRSINQSQLADLVSCHFHTPSLIPEVQEDWSLHLFCTKLHVKTIRPSVAPKLRPLYPIKKAKPSKKKLLKASKKKTSTTAHVYCICHGASQGNMIACDNEACKKHHTRYIIIMH